MLVLKEILSSDTPSILVEKLNYNFDQIFLNNPALLTVRGDKGEQGEQGISGLNGATIFNGTGDPNTLPSSSFFRPVMSGDYFINLDDGFLWYYDTNSSPIWINLDISLKAQEASVINPSSDSLFVLKEFIDTNNKGIIVKSDNDGVNKTPLIITQNENRLTSELYSASLVVSKPNLSSFNMIFAVDDLNITEWPIIDVQRPFFGATEKTQLIINSELVKISSSNTVTLSPAIGSYVQIENGGLKFPTTINNESDIYATNNSLRIRGKLIGSIKRLLLEDEVNINGELILTGQSILFPSEDLSLTNETVKIEKSQTNNDSVLRIILDNNTTDTLNNNDRLDIGGYNLSNFVTGAFITASGDSSFNNLTVRGAFVSQITPVLGSVIAGPGLVGGGSTLVTGGAVNISHADTSGQNNVNLENAPESFNLGGSVIKDINLDTYGHVISLSTKNLDDRYYKKSEVDSLNDHYIQKKDFDNAFKIGSGGINLNSLFNGSSNAAIINASVNIFSNGVSSYSINTGITINTPNTSPITGISGITNYKLVINYVVYTSANPDVTFIHFSSLNISELATAGKPYQASSGGIAGDSTVSICSGSNEYILSPGTVNARIYIHLWRSNENFTSGNGSGLNNINSVKVSYILIPNITFNP